VKKKLLVFAVKKRELCWNTRSVALQPPVQLWRWAKQVYKQNKN